MTTNINDFFTTKHKRLDQIARVASIFSWLVFIFFLLGAISQAAVFMSYQGNVTLATLIEKAPDAVFRAFLGMINTFFQGVVYGLVLKGVSVGLNMIIEIELNYREKFQGHPGCGTPGPGRTIHGGTSCYKYLHGSS